MFSGLARALGIVSVKETSQGLIEISGVPADVIARHIGRMYQTKRIAQWMFTKLTKNGFVFPSWFAVEFHYIAKQARLDAKSWGMQRALDRIIEGLEADTWLKGTLGDVKSMVDLTYLRELKWKAKPHQLDFLKAYGDMVPRYNLRGYYLASPPGTGKALTLDTKIKIPGGWTTMGELKVGDVVTAADGTATKVTGVFPQGVTDVYRLTFADGRTIDACGRHLWNVKFTNDVAWSTVSTLDALAALNDGLTVSLPLATPASTIETYQRRDFLRMMCLDLGDGIFAYHHEDFSMAEFVVTMVRSLGGIASLRADDVRGGYEVDIACRFLANPADVEHVEEFTLQLISVEKISPAATQCISVDHPSKLYVAGEYIVTHNTFMDLALATCVIPRSLAEVVIVISPKNALDVVWKDTIRELFHHEPKYWTSSQPGPAPVDRKIRYFVFHNEALDRALALAQQMAQRGIKFFVIVDESHNFNEVRSRRTQMLIKLLSGLRYKPFCIWASGSPIKALGTEAIPFLKSCDPLFTDDAERRFAKIFGGDSKFALELLAHRLGLITFKVSKDVVMSGTKPKTIQKNVQLPKALSDKFLVSTIREEMREYIAERLVFYRSEMETYQDQFDRVIEYHRERLPNSPDARQKFMRYMRIINQLRELQRANKRPDPVLLSIAKAYETGVMLPSLPADQRKKFKECQSVVKALKLKVTGEAIGKFLIPRRAECALELGRHGGLPQMIKESLSKTLVFSTSIKAVLGTAEYLKDVEGFEPRVVYQKTNHALPAIIKEFRDNPEINPVVATFQSLSTAVPMTMASTLIMLNLPFRQYLYDQTISRVYRLGQPYPVTIYEIVLDTGDELNVSTRALDILVWCREHLDVLLGGEFAGPSADDIIIENVVRTE